MVVAFERFLDLDATARLRLLAALAYEGTLDGRGAYLSGTDEVRDGPALRRVNEFVHRMVSLMRHVLSEEPNTDAYAQGLWTDLIQPWAEAHPGVLETLLQKAGASDL
jgi:hypothetical protein